MRQTRLLESVLCVGMVGSPTGGLYPASDRHCILAAVQPAKARTWFELCFIPLVPMKSKQVWICPICNWRMNVQDG
jgi:hypothetical protein